MNKPLAIATLFLNVSCGYLVSDPIKAPGHEDLAMRIEGLPVDQVQVEAILHGAELWLGKALPKDVTFTFVRGAFVCHPTGAGQQGSHLCTGTTETDLHGARHVTISLTRESTTETTSCVGATSLAHEAMHLLVGDINHTRSEIWESGGAVSQLLAEFKCR